MERGLIQVYTGDGKGKTTAASGLALRAAGHQLKVLIIQFMKGEGNSGELRSAEKLSPYLTIMPMGRKTFVSKSNPDPMDVHQAQEGLALARKAVEEKVYDIGILDEINVAVDYGLIPLVNLLQLLDTKPIEIEIVLTGRNARSQIGKRGDLVTEMVARKHYYDSPDIPARKGIEV